ncbi:hypothetical protein PTTG_26342 [Puccinia triticina 1-1 BBBD Race 1]|uniref:Uncharacterized protein n=1 Tax=Puccinia triticina (isolate 1-1 / race 1 (BBBD)) TaxID=630390 RepID=A0A180GUX7_PUCT1|nr:hypothetical protein PTTG_26342 [Puccinia triticina 1-1 BBBD Race 1]
MDNHSRNRLISPSEYSEWFHHPLTPPADQVDQHVPTIFDGTSHLVKERNRCRDAFIRSQERTSQLDPSLMGLLPVSSNTSRSSQLSLSQPTASQSQQHRQLPFDWPGSTFGRPKVPIGIEFLLFAPKPSPPPINTRNRQTIAPPVSSQYQKAKSEPGKLSIHWHSHDYNLEMFKAATINLIQHDEDKGLGLYARQRESEGSIVWNVIIPNGRMFAAAQKKRLDSTEIFKQFLQVAKATPESRKIICCLVQKDPAILAQVRAYPIRSVQ